MSSKSCLVLYIPAFHQGYINLLKTWANKGMDLYIIGNDIIADFPLEKREIRAIDPEIIKSIISRFDWFSYVTVLTKDALKDLSNSHIIMADEYISHSLTKKYLSNAKVEFMPVFLRWDESSVPSHRPVDYDTTLSASEFDRSMMEMINKEAQKSPDWFRQIGAAIVKDGKIILLGHNQRTPTPQSAYLEGDPRNFLPLGAEYHLHNGLHAEQTLIAEAAKQGISITGADLYVTTFPCPTCASLIAYCGIKRCLFKSGFSNLDAQTTLKNHGVEIVWVKSEEVKTPAEAGVEDLKVVHRSVNR